MHIVHLAPYYAPAYSFGGVVSMLEGLATAQVKRGHRVTVLTTDAGSLEKRSDAPSDEMRDGVRVRRARNLIYGLRQFNLSTPFGLRRIAQEMLADADILHIHEFRTVENQLVVPMAHKFDVPVVLSPHGTLTHETGRKFVKIGWDVLFSRRIAGLVDHLLALAMAEGDDALNLWSQLVLQPPPISVIPNGINPEEFAALPDGDTFRQRYAPDAKHVVLFMGRLHKRKGVDLLAKAFLQADIPDAVLVIAGPDEGMTAEITAFDDPRIVMTGYLDRQERLAALAAADVFALPATGEGISMAMLEALAAGVPALLSRGCNLPQVETSGAGQVLPLDVKRWAVALREMLADRVTLQHMALNARDLIESQFTWERVAAQMDDVYKDLTKHR